MLTAEEALQRLKDGNARYVESGKNTGNISPAIRKETYNGQSPYAIVIGCSDSRVIPETMFDAGIGELFVIRVAGNVIDNNQLGSIEYAAEHLGSRLVVVLGHEHCGAVDAAIHDNPGGHIKYITDEIRSVIGNEKDDDKACRMNVEHSVEVIERSVQIRRLVEKNGLKIVGAVYHLESGEVEYLEPKPQDEAKEWTEDYFVELNPQRRKDMLEEKTKQMEQVKTLFELRYAKDEQGNYTDQFLLCLMALKMIAENPDSFWGQKRNIEQTRIILHALCLDREPDYTREVLYREMCHLTAAYIISYSHDTHNEEVVWESGKIEDADLKAKISLDLDRIGETLPKYLKMESEFEILSAAIMDTKKEFL